MSRIIVVAALAIALSAPATSHAFDFRTVALTGQSAPETTDSVVFSNFTHAAINQSGEVAFNAELAGPGISPGDTGGGFGIWATNAGTIRKVIRSGDPAVGFSAQAVYGSPSRARIDDLSGVAAVIDVDDLATSAISDIALYSEGFGTLKVAAQSPISSTSPGYSGSGRLAFRAGVPSYAVNLLSCLAAWTWDLRAVRIFGGEAPGASVFFLG